MFPVCLWFIPLWVEAMSSSGYIGQKADHSSPRKLENGMKPGSSGILHHMYSFPSSFSWSSNVNWQRAAATLGISMHCTFQGLIVFSTSFMVADHENPQRNSLQPLTSFLSSEQLSIQHQEFGQLSAGFFSFWSIREGIIYIPRNCTFKGIWQIFYWILLAALSGFGWHCSVLFWLMLGYRLLSALTDGHKVQ